MVNDGDRRQRSLPVVALRPRPLPVTVRPQSLRLPESEQADLDSRARAAAEMVESYCPPAGRAASAATLKQTRREASESVAQAPLAGKPVGPALGVGRRRLISDSET